MQLTLSAVWLRLLLTLLLFEVQHAVMHHSAGELVDVLLLVLVEAQDVDSFLVSICREDVFKTLTSRIKCPLTLG